MATALTALSLVVICSAPNTLSAQAPAESVRQLVAYGAAMLPQTDRSSTGASTVALTGGTPESDLTALWSDDDLVTPLTGFAGNSSAGEDTEEEGRGKGTYILAGSALVGGALLFNFASGGGEAFPAGNGLQDDNTFLNRTLRPVVPPTTLGEIPFSDTHPTLPGSGPAPCGDPLSSNCLDPVLLGVQGETADVVPEPLTMTMLATGLVGLAAARRRRAA